MSHKTHLILVKHSLPEIVENIPAREWKLSVEGRKRARNLAERLFQYKPEILISSDELKARETAGIVGESLGLKYLVAAGLHEHDRSNSPFYDGLKFQVLVKKFFDKPEILVFGRETANQALSRFSKSIHSVIKFHNDKNIVVVSHGTVISLFISQLTGTPGYDLWMELGLPSFVEIDMQSNSLLKIENII